MPKRSAGLLFYRRAIELQVLLVHPGGPFFAKRDDGCWSIPKGEYEGGEDARAVALREFEEETGTAVQGDMIPLGDVRQAGGKIVTAFALEGDLDPHGIQSNLFEMEWPPRSGRRQVFPEVDRAGWFTLDVARMKLIPSQVPLLDRLQRSL